MRTFVLLIFSLFLGGFAFAQTPISDEDLSYLKEQMQIEANRAWEAKYKQQWILQRNDKGQIVQTDYLIVIFPGLYDKTSDIGELQDFLVAKFKQNVITVRYAGHYDKQLKMIDSVYPDWIMDFNMQKESWLPLGKKLVFIGHSTGGLLSLYFGHRYFDRTAAVVSLGPSFEQTPKVKLETFFGTIAKYDKWEEETQRQKVAKLGYEVESLADWTESSFKLNPEYMAKLPVLIVDTQSDPTVEPKANKEALKKIPGGEYRIHTVLPKAYGVNHRELRRNREHVLPLIADFLSTRLRSL